MQSQPEEVHVQEDPAHSYCIQHFRLCPSLAVMTCLVSKFLGRMTASSSPGFEDSSAPFLKYAYPGDEKDKNVIVPYLANLFHVALSEKRIPACWKKPRSPPFTKRLQA